MKRIIALLLALAMLAGLAACGNGKSADENSDVITMSVANGSMKSYLLEIQRAAKEKFDIDIELIYEYSSDTSNSLVNEFKNNDLSADIMVTAAAVNDEYLKDTCLDYLTNSHVTDYFTYSKVKEYTTEDGGVYQLPFTSKLIGVTYNKTLMEEMGWEVPNNYEEMLALKKKCDKEGILFAVAGGCAAGHGFNWLFHLMGADWISTLEGTEWFNSFINGETTVDAFAEEAKYFKKYYENGLFGEFYNANWESSIYYREQRALFNYDLTNGLSAAIRLNEDGTIYGAKYDKDGNVTANENALGDFVCIDGTWTLYDENNILHTDAQRYDIPGAEIDEFAAMPWISEDGSNNRYTCYDNMFVMVRKELGEAGNEEKLEKVLQVLEYMCSAESIEYFTNENHDGYVAVENFEFDSDRTYAAFAEQVKAGYIQPWYYILVDTNTLVNTGDAVNDYMAGGKTTYADIIDAFDQGVQDNVNQVSLAITNISQTFTYEELAQLLAYVGGTDMQNKVDEAGVNALVQVSLMPYTENRGDMALWSTDYLGLVSTKLYGGEFEEAYIGTIIPTRAKSAVAIEMTGAEINEIVENGLDRSEGGTNYDASYGPYPYAVVTRNGETIEDDRTYIVAVNECSLNQDVYQKFVDGGKILTGVDGNIVSGDLRSALLEYFKATPEIKPGDFSWE